MKKIISLTFVLVFMLSLVSAGNGAVWTTRNDCGNVTQNVNHYDIGDAVYINGANFDAGLYDWEIMGQPGQASCDPKKVVANDSYIVDGTGNFCFKAYIVKDDDCGEYKASFDKKHDNYHVVPEFGFFVGVLTLLSALGVFFMIRRE